jgi:acyl carrier protein
MASGQDRIEQLAARISEFVKEHAAEGAGLDDDLSGVPLNDLLDSLDMLELLAFIEGELGIEVAEDQVSMDRFRSIKSVARYLAELDEAG